MIFCRGDEPMPDINKITGLNRKYNDNVPIMNAIVFPDYITFYMINQIILPDAFS